MGCAVSWNYMCLDSTLFIRKGEKMLSPPMYVKYSIFIWQEPMLQALGSECGPRHKQWGASVSIFPF